MNLKLIKTLIRAIELDNGNHTAQLAAIIAAELGHGPVIGASEKSTSQILWTEPNADEVYAGLHISKLEAVKRYKNRTQYSILESKKLVEKYFTDNGLKFFGYK